MKKYRSNQLPKRQMLPYTHFIKSLRPIIEVNATKHREPGVSGFTHAYIYTQYSLQACPSNVVADDSHLKLIHWSTVKMSIRHAYLKRL